MQIYRYRAAAVTAIAALALAACSSETLTTPDEPVVAPVFSVGGGTPAEEALLAHMDAVNAGLATSGANYRVAIAEYVTSADGGEAGGTVLAKNVGNKQLALDFVPNDARRSWSGPVGAGDDITYAIDQTGDAVPPGGGLTAAQTTAAIQAAMGTWDAVSCSDLPIVQVPDFGIDIGVVAFLNGLGGSPFVFADVQHAGWRDINFAGGVLGVTFTFQFVDGTGAPTDIDGNGKIDAAFREIYYDPSWIWAIGGNVDVETVALHEAGHGLSQAHFGTVRFKNDGSLMASPRAVMNALYAGPLQSLTGSDNGGHCSNWAQWPNN
jgi:hypothetical protein